MYVCIDHPRHGNTSVQDALQVPVGSLAEVLHVLRAGTRVRATAPTDSNAVSSRSHAIFVLTCRTELASGGCLHGQLFCVDLAGSERVAKTGARAQR